MEAGFPRAAVARLEEVAARAVPAALSVPQGGWLLRATPGLATKRANSVLARADASGELGGRLSAVEEFYAGHGLPPRYQLCPSSRPDGLREALLARGYRSSAPVDVQVTELGAPRALATPTEFVVQIAGAAAREWWRTWTAAIGASSDQLTGVADLFGRIPGETGFACVAAGSEVVGVGMGVREGEWVGLFNMATLPAHRGRGAGRAALRALAAWAGERGARRAYLQVEAGNDPARSLYRRAGFRTAYQYAYLTGDGQ